MGKATLTVTMDTKALVAVFVCALAAIILSAEADGAWVAWTAGCSDGWSIDPPDPTTEDIIHFASPFIGDYSNSCFADLGAGRPTIIIDPVQRTVELWFEPQPPGACLLYYDPVCGVQGEFGALAAGEWVFFCNDWKASFWLSFEVGPGCQVIYVDDDAPDDPGPGDPKISDPAEDGSPEHPFDTIQEAIDAASGCDTVIVLDGTYTGGGNRDIDFGGKAIHLRSESGPENCTIDAEGSWEQRRRVFLFRSGEGESSIVEGFTITGGYAHDLDVEEHRNGGGIYCSSSSPTIVNNIITGNAGTGGGICVRDGSPVITNNIIIGNTDRREGPGHSYSEGGAGMYIYGSSSPIIAMNTVTGNTKQGLYIRYSTPTVAENTIVGNTAPGSVGAGICSYGSPVITSNMICDNIGSGAAGIYARDGFPLIANNIIARNIALNSDGGAIMTQYAAATIYNNTIMRNEAGRTGGAIYSIGGSPTITNGIIWGNEAATGAQIGLGYTSALTISYSDVEGGEGGVYVEEGCILNWGEGNIDADPLFADPDSGDYHLTSQYGRWDPHANGGAGGWVTDPVTSPCIDMGDPASDYANEPLPNGARINTGAHGNTAKASKSPPHWLTVQSLSVTGVNISGDKPGVTDYQAACHDGEVVNLTAPTTAANGDVDYNFVRWEGHPDGVATIQLTMDTDKTAVALYEVQTHTLTVESAPITSVAITGDKPGTTNYTATCDDELVVTLTAPGAVIVGDTGFEFVRWVVDGSEGPDGQNTVEITMDAAHTVTAVYQRVATVFLRAPGERGEGALSPATSDVDPAGFGEFTVDIYAENMPGFAGFNLHAEFLDSLAQGTPGFWVSYSTPNPLFGGRAIVHNTLFLPEIDQACMGQTVGLMSMEREWIPPFSWGDYVDKSIPPEEDLAAVNPPDMVLPGHEGLTWLMSVDYWYTSDVPQGAYTISVNEDNTVFGTRDNLPVEILYAVVPGSLTIGSSLEGDVNGDCVVNVLDMIAVRNHLYEDVGSEDNWRYDLTGDGMINVLDMIVVRSYARATCSE